MNLTKTRAARLGMLLPAFLLSGCLEAVQFPPYINGEYAGKPDELPYVRYFHDDPLAWWAAIENRTSFQNEYNRANP